MWRYTQTPPRYPIPTDAGQHRLRRPVWLRKRSDRSQGNERLALRDPRKPMRSAPVRDDRKTRSRRRLQKFRKHEFALREFHRVTQESFISFLVIFREVSFVNCT